MSHYDVQLGGLRLELSQGNIADQPDVTAVVNAANAQLAPGGGVAGAIHRAAGPGLYEECKPLAPIAPGEAVITGAHNLPNRYVIHTLGPIYGQDHPEDQLLRNCYENALRLAEEKRIESVAFPAISTGAFGYPVQEAARIALKTFLEWAKNLKSVKRIRMVLYSKSDYETHVAVLRELLQRST